MKNTIRDLGRRAFSLLLALSMVLSLPLTRVWAADGDNTDSYEVTVAASQTENITAGDTVTLTATVTKDGVEITDLAAAGLYLWWWTDVWAEGHTDGLSDATYSNYDDNSGNSLTADVTLPSVGTYYIAAELKDDSNSLTTSFTTLQVTTAGDSGDSSSEEETPAEYTVTVTPSTTDVQAGDTVTLTATVTKGGEEITDLAAAGLYLWWWTDVWAEGHTDGLDDATYSNYDNNSGLSLTADVTLPSEGNYYIVAELQDSSYTRLIDLTTTTFTVAAADQTDEDTDEGGDPEPEAPAGYAVTVTPSTTDVQAGDTVTLTATVTKDGEEITDLAAAGLYLWWWTDVWAEGHTDGLDDATYSNYDNNSGLSLTADVTLPSEGNYYIVAELQDSSYTRLIDPTTTTFNVKEAVLELTDIPLENGDFENGTTNWTLSGFSSVAADEWATNNTTNTLNLWLSDSEDLAGSAAYTVPLTAGTYQFGFDLSGAEMDSGLRDSVTAGGTVLASGSESYTTTGWDVWNTYTTDAFTLTEDTEVTFILSGTVPAGYWGNLDNLTLKGTGSVTDLEEDSSVEAEINVKKVQNLSDDFIMGMDISSVISEFNSGVTYQDFDGNTIDNVTDFCKFLAQCGVTHVRVRVWNDPFDADGNGYGGGNNDINAAVEIAKGCAASGLKLLVDFHYSDFWADPSKQQAPKAWAGYSLEEKAEAIQTFTTDSLTKIQATGVEIAMVQVGNETTGGFVGESSTENMCTLFSAGSAAIRAFDPSIQVVIHVTNPEKSTMTTWAKNLDTYGVDYDVLATSYYPYWHGTLDNLKSQLQAVQDTYGKDVMVAETSYAFTLDDTDGHDNTVRVGTNDNVTSYPFTPQGQAECIRDIIAAVNEAGGLGVFYWESAWITVGDTTGLTGDEYDAQVESNKAQWEANGSGWASSYAGEYDPDDAGVWYGGSAVDNQAMFYADGSPVASINVWNYVKTGAVSNSVSVDAIASPTGTVEAGSAYTLPETVTVTYSNGAVEEPVLWDADDVSAIDINSVGTYVVSGTVLLSKDINAGDYAGQTTAPTTYTLTVKAPNLIPADVASFEVADGSDFTIGGNGISSIPATDDPKEGTHSMHWYDTSAGTGTVTYNEVITLVPGTYTFEAAAQGCAGDTVTLNILDTEGAVLFSGEPVVLTGWAIWMTPFVDFEVTEEIGIRVQVEVNLQAGGWGTVDCLYLYQTGSPVPDDGTDSGNQGSAGDNAGSGNSAGTVEDAESSDSSDKENENSSSSASADRSKSDGGTKSSSTSNAAKTGDTSQPLFWILLAAASLAVTLFLAISRKRQTKR